MESYSCTESKLWSIVSPDELVYKLQISSLLLMNEYSCIHVCRHFEECMLLFIPEVKKLQTVAWFAFNLLKY